MGQVKVVRESNTGRNEGFQDGNKNMTRNQFVKEIKQGNYENYHIRNINGVDTPVSNPDSSKKDNLG